MVRDRGLAVFRAVERLRRAAKFPATWVFACVLGLGAPITVAASDAPIELAVVPRVRIACDPANADLACIDDVSRAGKPESNRKIVMVFPRHGYLGGNIVYSSSRSIAYHLADGDGAAVLCSLDCLGGHKQLCRLDGVSAFGSKLCLDEAGERFWILAEKQVYVVSSVSAKVVDTIPIRRVESRYTQVVALGDQLVYATKGFDDDLKVRWECSVLGRESRSLQALKGFGRHALLRMVAVKQVVVTGCRQDLHAPESGMLQACDPKSGRIAWSLSNVFPLSMDVFQDHVVVADGSHEISFLSVKDGTIRGRIKLATANGAGWLAVVGDRLLVIVEGSPVIYQIASLGETFRRFTKESPVVTAVVR